MTEFTARRLVASAIVLGCLARAPDGVCQSGDDRVGARAAATEGAKAFSEKRWSDAIDYFKRAESLLHAPPHLLYMARAQAETGALVESRENYLSVVHEELKADAPQVFRTAKESAAKELSALEGRLPYATLVVKGDVPRDIAVMQDGTRFSSALLGIPRPVNPGAHKFEATAKGLAGSATIQIKEGERQKVVIELVPSSTAGAPLPPLEPAAAATPVPAPTSGPAESQASAPPPAPPAADEGTSQSGGKSKGLLIGSFIGFGVGAAGIALGTVFTLIGSSKSSDADNAYNANDCRNSGCKDQVGHIADLDNQAKSAKTIGIVGFVVGGVGVATGVTLLVLHGKSGHSAAARGDVPSMSLALGPSSLLVNGAF